MSKVNFESDFIAKVTLPASVGEHDFGLDLYTTGQKVIKVGRTGGRLSGHIVEDEGGGFNVIFVDHGLQPGELMAKATYGIHSDIAEGTMKIVTKFKTGVELTRGATDAAALPVVELAEIIPGTSTGEGDSKPQTPVNDFTLYVGPVGDVAAAHLNETTITSIYPIASYDLANVRYKKQFGNVWFDTMGEAVLSEDKKQLKLTWNLVADNYPVGTALVLEIPAGAIVADNGAKNLEYMANVNVVA